MIETPAQYKEGVTVNTDEHGNVIKEITKFGMASLTVTEVVNGKITKVSITNYGSGTKQLAKRSGGVFLDAESAKKFIDECR